MSDEWEKLVQGHEWYELDVCSKFDILDGDVMALKVLGSSLQEDKFFFGAAQGSSNIGQRRLQYHLCPCFQVHLYYMFVFRYLKLRKELKSGCFFFLF